MVQARQSTWSFLAFLGFLVVFFSSLVATWDAEPGGSTGLLPAALASLACLLTLALGFRAEVRLLIRQPTVFVPLGLTLGLMQLLSWLSLLPALGSQSGLQLVGLSLSVSVTLVLELLLWVLFAAWTTASLLQLDADEPVHPATALTQARRRFLPVLLAMGICVFCLFALLALALPLGAMGFWLFGLVLMPGCLLLNLASMALLPTMVESTQGAWRSFRAGLATSWRHRGRWFGLLLVQWALLGMFTIMRSGNAFHSSHKINLNAKWLGGFCSDCAWYEDSVSFHEIPSLPLVELGLMLLFLVLAMTIKLRVIAVLRAGRPAGERSASELT